MSHTHEVLGVIQQPFTVLREAQSDQRAYVLTGEERFLAPYHERLQAASQAIAELRRLTADNRDQ